MYIQIKCLFKYLNYDDSLWSTYHNGENRHFIAATFLDEIESFCIIVSINI